MYWRVSWFDEDEQKQTRIFYHSTTATRFVCETHERLPESDIIFETLMDRKDEEAEGDELAEQVL